MVRAHGCKLHFLQQRGETTLARLPPTVDLGQDALQRELRQIQTQRFQHADDNRLPASTDRCLVGPARLARLGCPRSVRSASLLVPDTGWLGAVGLSRRLGRHEREQLLVPA